MNSKYTTTNLLLFTLEKCSDYNCKSRPSFAWRIQSHNLFFCHPRWGCWQFTRLSAFLQWVGTNWEALFPR